MRGCQPPRPLPDTRHLAPRLKLRQTTTGIGILNKLVIQRLVATLCLRRIWLALALCLSIAGVRASESSNAPGAWVEEASGDYYTVHARSIPNQIVREIKVEVQLNVPIEAMLTVLGDVETFPDWVPRLTKANWVMQPDPMGISYVYIATKVPWPVKNRDMVIRTQISHDSTKREIYMLSDSAAEKLPITAGYVRIPTSRTLWTIRQIDSGSIEAVLTSHVDPGGQVPKWLANLVVVGGAERMVESLAATLANPKWLAPDYPYDMDYVFGYANPLADW